MDALERLNRKKSVDGTKRSIQPAVTVVWIDATISRADPQCQNVIDQLLEVTNTIKIFQETNDCIKFLDNLSSSKAIIICSGFLGRHLVPRVHSMEQVHEIYIFCANPNRHGSWTKEWTKIQGVDDRIESICQVVLLTVRDLNKDAVALSFVRPDDHLTTSTRERLESAFMYTKMFKNILLQMKYDERSRDDFVSFCREIYRESRSQIQLIDEFDRDYLPNKAIWWYTRECFPSQILNQALRLLQANMIVCLGFFIHDLNRQIAQLYVEQLESYDQKPFLLYRGQSLSMDDFEKLQKTRDGLISFNSFLSTNTDRSKSLRCAEFAAKKENSFGILFVMTIDPNIDGTPFARIQDESYFGMEGEVLFSMHSVFRIGEFQSLDDHHQLFQVQLTLTADQDELLKVLSERIEEEVGGGTGWQRLGSLLIKVGDVDKAEDLYLTLLNPTSAQVDQAHCLHRLASMRENQGDHHEAVRYYEQALKIEEKIRPACHPALVATYNNLGLAYANMKDYPNALFYYGQAVDIQERTRPFDDPALATSYNNIGEMYFNTGDSSSALRYYEKARKIEEQSLPLNYPSLATSLNSIGEIYYKQGKFAQALSYYQRALDIYEKVLPAQHPLLAASYDQIGLVYSGIGQSREALSHHHKAAAIHEKTLPADHPALANCHQSIGRIYFNTGDYSQALSHLERSLNIREESLPADHTDLLDVRTSVEILKKLVCNKTTEVN